MCLRVSCSSWVSGWWSHTQSLTLAMHESLPSRHTVEVGWSTGGVLDSLALEDVQCACCMPCAFRYPLRFEFGLTLLDGLYTACCM